MRQRTLGLFTLLLATSPAAAVPPGASVYVPSTPPAPPPGATAPVTQIPTPAPDQATDASASGAATQVVDLPKSPPTSSPQVTAGSTYVGPPVSPPAPVARTITYPAGGGGSLILETRNLELGDDGYYHPTAAGLLGTDPVQTAYGIMYSHLDNWFIMHVPEAASGSPISVRCVIKGEPRASANISWRYVDGPLSGNAGVFPPAGATEYNYTLASNVTHYSAAPITEIMIHSLLPATGLQSCTVSGTFLQ